MNNDIHFMLLSGVFAIAGMLLLYLASHWRLNDRSKSRSWAVVAFLFAGLLLVLPLFIWSWSLVETRPSSEAKVSPTEVLLLSGYLSAAFLWFVWNLNALTFEMPDSCSNPWEVNWGASYSPELKKRLLGALFQQLEEQGKIGDLVVDVGSGQAAVSRLLPRKPGRKFICIDIAARRSNCDDELRIQWDAEKIDRSDLLSYRKALVRIARFLGIDLRVQKSRRLATTILFSDILNYVDYKKVLGGFAEFLHADGRLIISNLPGRGIHALFSDRGLKDNVDLCGFLSECGCEIEYKDFPCRPRNQMDESEEMIVLVAGSNQEC